MKSRVGEREREREREREEREREREINIPINFMYRSIEDNFESVCHSCQGELYVHVG